jgi:hypothetical protein
MRFDQLALAAIVIPQSCGPTLCGNVSVLDLFRMSQLLINQYLRDLDVLRTVSGTNRESVIRRR